MRLISLAHELLPGVSPIGGGQFALTGIDLSKANTFSTTSATGVEVIGNLFGGGTVSTTLTLANAFSFTTFTFDSTWTNLSSVVPTGIGATCSGRPERSRGTAGTSP